MAAFKTTVFLSIQTGGLMERDMGDACWAGVDMDLTSTFHDFDAMIRRWLAG